MDNKELNKVLQQYAESTKNDKDIAFKKLNEKSNTVRRANKHIKPQYIFAVAMCVVVVLSIVLPITLSESQVNDEPTYCSSGSIVFKAEENLSILINNFGMNAYFPTFKSDGMGVCSVLSRIDSTLHGANIGFVLDEDMLIVIDMAIIPKTHILQMYEDYFDLTNEQEWRHFQIKYSKEFNTDNDTYETKVYFTDGKYDYFVEANSDDELNQIELLNMLYT